MRGSKILSRFQYREGVSKNEYTDTGSYTVLLKYLGIQNGIGILIFLLQSQYNFYDKMYQLGIQVRSNSL